MSQSSASAAERNDKRCGGAALTTPTVETKSRSSEFKQLHRHYALQRRDVVQKSASKGEYAPAPVVQGSAWVDDYSCSNASEGGDPLSDSEEDDDDFDRSAMTAKRDATATLLLAINQPGEPSRGALLDVVIALRADFQAQRRKWRRAAEDTTALLQHFRCRSADDNGSSPEMPESAELMRMDLAKIVARDVGAQDVDVVHTTVFFELMRLMQELQRGERMRWVLLQTADELQALVPALDREWQRLQEAADGRQQQPQPSSDPQVKVRAASSWWPSTPQLASSGPQRDYLSRGASRTVGRISPTPPERSQTQSQPQQTRVWRLQTATEVRNEAEAQRPGLVDEARALDALRDEPEPKPGDHASGGESAREDEGDGGEMKARVNALREFADLIDTVCGQGMALVSVNEVIAAIAEDIKEKLRKAAVGVREEMKPVLYSGEADRDEGEVDDDELEDEGLDQGTSGATTSFLNSASVLKRGWLVKKGEVRRNWKVRYFVLFEDGRMPYYRAPKKAQKDRPQGCIYLTGKVRLVRPATDKSVPPNLWAVEVVTATRTYVLCCRSQADLDLWCFHLQSFCSL